ncbi:MAG: TauD/TfdA family dioxygenase [Pseudomonadales bacterium]|nr:TauD/TfdA family dioxygenase [Pseudomonadales bacterium]
MAAAGTADARWGMLAGSSRRGASSDVHALDIRPLTPTIGAVVHDLDLGRLDEATFEALHEAWMRHLVLFFRDQHLTPEQHLAFGRRLGPLHIHPAAPFAHGNPALMVIHTDAGSHRNNGDNWHTDVSADEEPPLGTILHLHTLPSGGGDTLFANMYAAFETLSPRMQDFLCTLTARHESNYDGHYGDHPAQREYPSAVHPVVRTHPVTGRNALFVNPAFTTRIVELSQGESDALLRHLYAHASHPRFQCRFSWTANAVALWDDRCTWHLAIWDYWPQTRSGLRVTVQGDRPYFDAASRREHEAGCEDRVAPTSTARPG